jgi:hypothetical protein
MIFVGQLNPIMLSPLNPQDLHIIFAHHGEVAQLPPLESKAQTLESDAPTPKKIWKSHLPLFQWDFIFNTAGWLIYKLLLSYSFPVLQFSDHKIHQKHREDIKLHQNGDNADRNPAKYGKLVRILWVSKCVQAPHV